MNMSPPRSISLGPNDEKGEINFALHFSWVPVESGPGAGYLYPQPLATYVHKQCGGPAVYRWIIYRRRPGDLKRLYIGETESLTQRLRGYLNPGPSQTTNQRIKLALLEAIREGSKVCLEQLQFEPITLGELSISMVDLKEKAVRKMLENLFAVYYARLGYTVMNL